MEFHSYKVSCAGWFRLHHASAMILYEFRDCVWDRYSRSQFVASPNQVEIVPVAYSWFVQYSFLSQSEVICPPWSLENDGHRETMAIGSYE